MNYRCVSSVSFSSFFTQIRGISTDFMIIFVKPVLSPNVGVRYYRFKWLPSTISLSSCLFLFVCFIALARHASSEKDESMWDRNADLEISLCRVIASHDCDVNIGLKNSRFELWYLIEMFNRDVLRLV